MVNECIGLLASSDFQAIHKRCHHSGAIRERVRMGNNPTALQVPDRLQPRTYRIKRPRTPGDAIPSVLADGSRAGRWCGATLAHRRLAAVRPQKAPASYLKVSLTVSRDYFKLRSVLFHKGDSGQGRGLFLRALMQAGS